MAAAGREAILEAAIGMHPGISKTDLQMFVEDDMAKATASRALGDLVKAGKIIERKEGRRIRYYPQYAAEDGLNEDLVVALDGYVEELCALKEGAGTYPYDLLNAFNNKIRQQRDDLTRLKKRLEDELKFEHAVEDTMRDYNEMYGDIVEPLGIFRRLVDDDTRRKIHECMTAMSGRLRQKATKQFELRTKRKSLGKGETRDSLTKEIKQLDSDMDEIFERASNLQLKISRLKSRKGDDRLWGPFAPTPVRWLQRVEEGRTRFQSLVEEALAAKTKVQDDGPEHWQYAEDGLTRVRGQLSDMKGILAETEEVAIKSYIDAELYERQKELSSLVDETLETYRP